MVDMLEKQGLPIDHPVRETAQHQADAAKRAWEDSRPGVAVSKRLMFAEQALARARKSQSRMEQSIDDLDMEYEAERDKRVRALHDLRARTRAREEFLAQLSRQAAEEYQGGTGGAAGDRARVAVATIDGPIRDAIQEAHDSAPAGSDLRTRLSGALGALAEVTATIAGPARERWADAAPPFDNSEEDDRWEDGWWGNGGCGQWYTNPWCDGDGCGWTDGDHDADFGGAEMDTDDVAVPEWMAGAAATAAGDDGEAALRANKRWRKAAEDPGGVQGRQADYGAVPHDHEQAARLQAALCDAARSQVATPAPPTPNLAEQALECKRKEVWDLAQDQGAEVTYEAISSMSLAELDEWQTAYLL